MPKVRDSSGIMGTTRRPICLSRSKRGEDAHERHRGRDLALARSLELVLEHLELGHLELRSFGAADRNRASETLPALPQIAHLGRVVWRFVVLGREHLLIRERQIEAVAKLEQGLLSHLFGLVGDHLPFAGATHPIALDRLGEDYRGLPLVLDRRVVGRENLLLVMATAVEQPDFFI